MHRCNGVIPCPDYLASGTGGIKHAVHVDRHNAAHGWITTVTTVDSHAGSQRQQRPDMALRWIDCDGERRGPRGTTPRGLSLFRALNPVHDAAVDTENVEAVPTPLALTA